jgi:hypothetical protein
MFILNERMPLVTVPEGKSGKWSVVRFTVSEEDAKFTRLQAAIGGRARDYVPEGTYTKLCNEGGVVMSDTPSERREHYPIVFEAKGHVLMSGLGIGMALQACLLKPVVESVTVIEIEADVIALVAPHYQAMFGDRFKLVHADVREWKPAKGIKYQAVWHDIWSDICSDNWPDMVRIKRRFQHYAEWQGCWCEAETKRVHRNDEIW